MASSKTSSCFESFRETEFAAHLKWFISSQALFCTLRRYVCHHVSLKLHSNQIRARGFLIILCSTEMADAEGQGGPPPQILADQKTAAAATALCIIRLPPNIFRPSAPPVKHIPPQFYLQFVYKATLSFTLRIQMLSGILFLILISILKQKFTFLSLLCWAPLNSADATVKEHIHINGFFCLLMKVEKNHQLKLLRNTQIVMDEVTMCAGLVVMLSG